MITLGVGLILITYGLIIKTTITNIINTLLKILIFIPLWPFSPPATVCFRFSPNFLTSWVLVPDSLPCIFTLLSLPHTFPIIKIHHLQHLRHGLHLELKFYLGRGWCVVLILHDSTCKNWLVVKTYSHIARVLIKKTLNILTCSHLSSHLLGVLAELRPTPNITT